MNSDKEINAMQTIANALDELEEKDAISRVLRWVADRFQIAIYAPGQESSTASKVQKIEVGEASEYQATIPDNLAEFFSVTNPTSEEEKVLIVSYWLQEQEGHSEVQSFEVNKELAHLGYPIGNIARAFDRLIKCRPALAVQTRKSGSTKQARRKFKLTVQGIHRIEEMTMRGSQPQEQ